MVVRVLPYPELHDITQRSARLIEACKEDQRVRMDPELWKHHAYVLTVNEKNIELLKQIISVHGWPKRSLVGDEAENAAWLIAQHATNDLSFMEKVLAMRKALPEYETLSNDTALLEDRVLMLKGESQRYGSQIHKDKEGKVSIPAIEGIDTDKLLAGDKLQMEMLNARRKTVGLDQPYSEYLSLFGISVQESKGKSRV